MKLKLLGSIAKRLKAGIRKQPEFEGQKVLMTREMIDSVLASRDSEVQEELGDLLDSVIQDRIEEIQELNKTLRGKN